jgi:hypothetical protein
MRTAEYATESRSSLVFDFVMFSVEGKKSGTFLDSGAMLPEHRARANPC